MKAEWKEIEQKPDPPPPTIHYRLEDSSGNYVLLQRETNEDWWAWMIMSGGKFLPFVNGESPPKEAALEHMIDRTEAFLDWLKEQRDGGPNPCPP